MFGEWEFVEDADDEATDDFLGIVATGWEEPGC
jgi:hypothetical protein